MVENGLKISQNGHKTLKIEYFNVEAADRNKTVSRFFHADNSLNPKLTPIYAQNNGHFSSHSLSSEDLSFLRRERSSITKKSTIPTATRI